MKGRHMLPVCSLNRSSPLSEVIMTMDEKHAPSSLQSRRKEQEEDREDNTRIYHFEHRQ